MTAITHSSGLPSFLAPAPKFFFFEQAEVSVPAPEVYERWRTADLVEVCSGWFFHQPGLLLLQAGSEEQALDLVEWEQRRSERWQEEIYRTAKILWLRKRPWWLT